MSPERTTLTCPEGTTDPAHLTESEAGGGAWQGEEEEEAELDDVIRQLDIDEAERAVLHAKLELLRTSDQSGVSLYDHLAELLAGVLTDPRPDQAVDNLELLSHRLKVTRITSAGSARSRTDGGIGPGLGSGVEETSLPVEREPTFVGELAMLKTIGRERMQSIRPPFPADTDAERLAILPDMMRQCYMFNMAGFGLPVSDYTRLALAMRELVLDWPLKSIRFWGKILGLYKDYYIVETEFQDGDYESETGSQDGGDDGRKKSVASETSDTVSKEINLEEEEEIRPVYKPPVSIPSEESGVGTNAKVYFVCNEPGLSWTRLPHVTPAQIVASRQIKHFFTGHLDHVHATFPPFPGNEANYLRAQVARITSSTSVSPIGYFKFDEEGEEEEEHEESRDTCIRDEDFDGVSPRDLSDAGMAFWVHHSNYIIPQGRTAWFNPVLARRAAKQDGEDAEDDDEDEDEGDEEERKEPDEPEPEIPQPLLIPLSEDVDVGPSPAWLARLTSQFVPEHSPVAVSSVTWPGAVAVAIDRGKFFENLYVGFGQKQLDSTFDPATPEEPQMEFPTGPEVSEQDDPTPGEEAAIKAALREQEEWELLRGKRKGDTGDDDEEEDEDDEDYEGDDDDVGDYDDNDDDY